MRNGRNGGAGVGKVVLLVDTVGIAVWIMVRRKRRMEVRGLK